MKKIADLNFYAFAELFKILKSKFPKHFVEFHSDTFGESNHISITSVAHDATEEGEMIMEVYDKNSSTWEDIEKIDTSDSTMEIQLYTHSLHAHILIIEKKTFDDEKFINKLKSLIGKIAPVRKKVSSEVWNEEVSKWAKKLIHDSGIKKFCLEITR